MKAKIEIPCLHAEAVIQAIAPDIDENQKFNISIEADDKIKLKIEAKDISGLLAGINSYMKLIKVSMEALQNE